MKASKPSELRNHLGERLDFSWHAGNAAVEKPGLVVIGHGVTGNKDRPLLVAVANALAERGWTALRFSFAGNGTSEGRFGESTISKEVEELGAVFAAFPAAEITYVGHSMGAAVGVLRASRDARIRRLVSLAGMAHPAAFVRREFGTAKLGEACMWDKEECPLSQVFLDDMEQIGTVLPAARAVRVPWLFVHGLTDDVVPVQDSRDLHQVAGETKRLDTLDGADHVFTGAATPLMTQTVVAWMERDIPARNGVKLPA